MKGRLLLQSLHRTILKRYDAEQDDLRVLLADGSFNCVSSSVIFAAAAEWLGFQAGGVIVPSHAYARFLSEGRAWEVETTTPAGFDPDRTRPEMRKHLERVAQAAAKAAAEGNAAQAYRLDVDALTLASFVYMNRGARAANDGDVEAAASYFERARRLGTQDALARRYRDSALAGFAVERIQAKDCPAAIELMATVLEGGGEERETGRVVRNNLAYCANDAANRKDFAVADRALEVLRAAGPSDALRTAEANVGVQRAVADAKAGRHGEATEALVRAFRASPDDAVVRQNLLFAYQQAIEGALSSGDPAGAVARGRELLAAAPGVPDAKKLCAYALASAGGAALERDPGKALSLFEEAWKLEPADEGHRNNVGVAWARVAFVRFEAGDVKGAIAAWEKALAIRPAWPEVEQNLAIARKRLAPGR